MIHRRLLQLGRPVFGAVALLAASGVLMSGLRVLFALFVASLITKVVGGGEGLGRSALCAAIVIALLGVGSWARELLTTATGVRIRTILRRSVIARIAGIPASRRDSGAVAATAMDGIDGLDAYYSRYLPQLVVAVIVPIAVVVIVWFYAPIAGIVLAVAVLAALVIPRLWDARLLSTGRERWGEFAQLASTFVEALQNIPLLRVLGATGSVAHRVEAESEGLRSTTMAHLRFSIVETFLSTLAMHLGIVLTIVAAIGEVFAGRIEPGAAVAVLMLVRECFRPVTDLTTAWHAGYAGLMAVDGLEHLYAQTPKIYGARTRSVDSGQVELRGVTQRYENASTGVSDVSVRVEAGESVALIGTSGAGKSTVARLLDRELAADSGSILFDGDEIADFSRMALARSVIVVGQDPVFFAWTVADNLRLYWPEARQHDIEQAATAAHAHDLIVALPHGYDTVLAENAENLSGGQRQRLAIARALLSHAPVMVLDEVTSALDVATERRVMTGIAAHEPKRTTIMIAHRPSACVGVNRWLSMRGGRVVREGVGVPADVEFRGGVS